MSDTAENGKRGEARPLLFHRASFAKAIRPGLAIRLTLILIVVTALAMAVMGFYITRALKAHAVRDLKADLETHARLIHDDLAPLLTSSDNLKQIQELAKHYRVTLGGRVTVIAFNGRVLGESELMSAGFWPWRITPLGPRFELRWRGASAVK